MAEKLTEDQVRHVAKLGRLRLSEEEVRHFAVQLSNVLGYMSKLGELNVEGIEPMAHPHDTANVLRADEPTAVLAVKQVLANAPDASGPFFKVPKVLGEAEGA